MDIAFALRRGHPGSGDLRPGGGGDRCGDGIGLLAPRPPGDPHSPHDRDASGIGTTMLLDLRFALRLLLKNPGFTAVAVLTLGLAVAANTVVFSVVNAILIRPLPFAEPSRLVQAHTKYPQQWDN